MRSAIRAGVVPVALRVALYAAPVVAQWSVDSLRVRTEGQRLVVNARAALVLSSEVETALSRGVPLTLVVDVRARRAGWWPFGRTVGEWKASGELRYHALSGYYIAGRFGRNGSESFATLRGALDQMGRIDNLTFQLPGPVEPDRLRVQFRVRLEIAALPAPLQPVAYTSSAWRLKSDWTQWPSAQ
jgi:hypothetical protein